MGIIDQSTTYTFFYALPLAFLILYLTPFFLKYYYEKELSLNTPLKIIWLFLAVIICLSGPLNPGVVLIFTLMLVFLYAKKIIKQKSYLRAYTAKTISKDFWFFVLPISLLSIYSLYIGTHNSVNIESQLPLKDLYLKLPEGLLIQFTNKLGFPLLFIMIIINTFLIKKKHSSPEGLKIIKLINWVIFFSVIYIILLPLGGYRSYRPHVLRFDTILPITIGIICIFGISTLYIIKTLKAKNKIWYITILIGVLFVFMNSDEALFDKNKCEKIALEQIAKSKDSIVVIENDCNVLSWEKMNKPKDSELNAQLLQIWNITKDKKLYYNK
jgi:hypothetical protein